MKIYKLLPYLAILIVVISNSSCEKDPIESRSGNPGPGVPYVPAPADQPPVANANGDLLVEVLNETLLSGGYAEGSNKVTGVSWAKISGPDAYTLENKNALGTKLSGLEKGVYQFELTVTDAKGLYDKDTMKVVVGEISANPKDIVFKNLVWGYEGPNGTLLWGTIIRVRDIYSYLPAGSIFRVYLKSATLPDWTEMVQDDSMENAIYASFFLKNGNLYVGSSSGESGTANLKIVY